MSIKIRDEKLIKSNNTNETGGVLEIIRNKTPKSQSTKLSQVLEFIPAGIVQKDETGMGATTLELQSLRNSIIVEPIKITASSKAHSHTLKSGELVLYVGSETKFHNKKVTKKQIKEYVNDPNISYKKIMVVADSLSKVIEAIGPNVFKDFFLMIDEVDSFQMDSNFRRSMEECIDFYKEFPDDKRCMLSATNIPFSDPKLLSEITTKISYDTGCPRNILVINSLTNQLWGNVVERVKEILQSDSSAKIMVAYNSVSGARSIAEFLLKDNVCNKTDLKILCSVNSKENAGEFFTELQSDTLPGKINFVTSAYFTGFDLNEAYHLISVSGNKSIVHTLSDKRLKQIAGRCRVENGLLSETIIHDIIDNTGNTISYSAEEIINSANIQLKALKCLEDNFKKTPLLGRIQMHVTKQLLKSLDEINSRFIVYDKITDESRLSYLNIDSYIENNAVRNELYQEYDKLSNVLKEAGHIVVIEKRTSTTVVDKVDIDTTNKEQKVEEVISFLRNNPSDNEIIERLETGKNSPIQKKILNHFYSLKNYIDEGQLLDLFEDAAVKRDAKQFDNLIKSAEFVTMAPGDIYKARMNKYFLIGKELTVEKIMDLINNVYSERLMPLTIDSPTKAVRQLKLFYNVKKIKAVNGNPAKYKIVSENPKKFKVNATKPELEDLGKFSTII
jgi:hypothetical protein